MAIRANIVLDQGSDFLRTFNITDDDDNPVDISDYEAHAQMRRHYTSLNFYEFDVEISNNGILSLSMSSNVTDGIMPGRYVYDCEVTADDGKKSRIVEGIVTVTPQVTR